MEEEDLFERFMEEILASLEATSTEDGSAKRVTTAIWSERSNRRIANRIRQKFDFSAVGAAWVKTE